MLRRSYYDSADENIVRIVVVENREGLDAVEDIAATPGVDVIFIGTSDLAFSLGHRGNIDAPEVVTAIERITAAAKRHGKYLGRPASSPMQIQQWRKLGFQLFQTGTELSLLTAGAGALLDPLDIRGLSREQRSIY